MLEPKTKIVNNQEYKVLPFPAMEAIKLKTKILKLIAPALGKILGDNNVDKEFLQKQIGGTALANAFTEMLDSLSGQDFENLVLEILRNTSVSFTVDGKQRVFNIDKTNFDIVFEGKLVDVYKVIWFVLETNYSDFFTLIKGKGGGGLL